MSTKFENLLCSVILKESFGELVQAVGTDLAKNGKKSLKQLCADVHLPLGKVKKALWTLLQHNLAYFEVSKRGIVEYGVHCPQILLFLRYPKYMYYAKTLYGDMAELLVEEILSNGQMRMSVAIERVMERLPESDSSSPYIIRDKFKNLVDTHFIQRAPAAVVKDAEAANEPPQPVPTLVLNERDLYSVPDIKMHLLKPRSSDKSEPVPESPCKYRKLDASRREEEKQVDEGIFWRINFDRFHQHMRDQLIISCVATRIDRAASEVVRAILRLAETTSDPWAPCTNPVSRQDISNALKNDKAVSAKLDSYLTILTEDRMRIVSKVDDRAGGQYAVNMQLTLERLAEGTCTAVVQDRFGSKACRIFRLLLDKKYMEQRQIEGLVMISAKEAKELMYSLFEQNFIKTHEIPRTPDHAPSRTFYLFNVDLNQVCRMLIEWCYKAIFNTITLRMHKLKENKRLLDKQQRVDAIITNLRKSGTPEEQISEVEEIITHSEKMQLEQVKCITKKLDNSELQVDETVFVLSMWLQSLLVK